MKDDIQRSKMNRKGSKSNNIREVERQVKYVGKKDQEMYISICR